MNIFMEEDGSRDVEQHVENVTKANRHHEDVASL